MSHSDQYKNIIDRLLTKNPCNRPDSQEIFKDEFFEPVYGKRPTANDIKKINARQPILNLRNRKNRNKTAFLDHFEKKFESMAIDLKPKDVKPVTKQENEVFQNFNEMDLTRVIDIVLKDDASNSDTSRSKSKNYKRRK